MKNSSTQCFNTYGTITTYNRFMTFAQLSQSSTNPEHKEADSIPVSIHINACELKKLNIFILIN